MTVLTTPSSPKLRLAAPSNAPNMNRVATIILGGGQGARLFPLTQSRCKPAMSFGGRYRLIDIPISNSVNSGCQKIFIITQFLSSSLHQHIFKTYRFGSLSSGFIELLPAEEKPKNKAWFQGTADAVRQNLDYFAETAADYFLILSGDQLYKMDFRGMVQFAQDTNADVVVASTPVNENDAKRMGILQINDDNAIVSFHEKPQQTKDLCKLSLSSLQANRLGTNQEKNLHYLGSMGIYLFKRKVLFDLLQNDSREDFGKHLIPTQVDKGKIFAYVQHGYWEDIGTVESFYQANIALTQTMPSFDCYNEEWPIFSSYNILPGARLSNTHVNHSIVCEGSHVDAKEINHSIIGQRSLIHSGVTIKNSYIFGNDYYDPPTDTSRLPTKFQIGENSVIYKAIIDKHVCIGKRVQLINKNQLTNYDSDIAYIRDGIIVIPRGATIPDDFVL